MNYRVGKGVVVDHELAYQMYVTLGRNANRVAKRMGVNRQTIYSMRRRDGWDERYAAEQRDGVPALLDAARAQLAEYFGPALATLYEATQAEDAAWRDRILAASKLIEHLPQESRQIITNNVLALSVTPDQLRALPEQDRLKLAMGSLQSNVDAANAERARRGNGITETGQRYKPN